MKALSLTQPWATLLAGGRKRWETRSWRREYRGPLLIHAAKGFGPEERALCDTTPFRWALSCIGVRSADDLPLGAVIGGGRLVTVLPIPGAEARADMRLSVPPAEPERSFGDYTPGRYAWLFARPRMCRPIPLRGHLGLWDVDPAQCIFEPAPLTRVVNLRWREPYDVYVGRPNGRWALRGSLFHNPFRLQREDERLDVLSQYVNHLRQYPELIEAAIDQLPGKTLGCWCAPALCHADVLAMLANGLSLEEVTGELDRLRFAL